MNLDYLKPSYYGLRQGIKDYFGPAYSVKDADGNELVRFVVNGDILVLKGSVYVNQSNMQAVGLTNSFVVKASNGDKKAVITPEGDLYLAGTIDDRPCGEDQQVNENEQAGLAEPDGKAFIIRNASHKIVSLIDADGNLKALGKVIVKGIPYALKSTAYAADPYSVYQ